MPDTDVHTDTETKCILVIISGRSGSGKSTALHALEDAEYYCIDNLPVGLLPQLVDQATAEDVEGVRHIAVGIDARNIQSDISRFEDILRSLDKQVSSQVVFLDADDGCLLKRFSETRRRHPLSSLNISLTEALSAERDMLQPIAHCAALTIDTSALTLHELRDLINRSVVRRQTGMTVLIESFGFRNGPPINADLVFDVRCLPNPHWVPSLRARTGLDQEVINFLAKESDVVDMLNDITRYLDRWLPSFAASNRSYITVAIGCTGGQHRSVYLCECVFAHFHNRFLNVQIRHRELGNQRSNDNSTGPSV